MTDAGGPLQIPPFPKDYRSAGILLHVTSLSTRFGIGDLGPAAHAWIDRLHDAGLRWWQMLPLGPTGYGDSPYQSLSSFAGNELLISPQVLIDEGLLRPDECRGRSFPEKQVDYGAVIPFKLAMLERVRTRFFRGARPDMQPKFDAFCRRHAAWLDDYALFRALKARHHQASYLKWPAALIRRNPKALASARHDLAEQIDTFRLAQFLWFRQARRLKEHAQARGVRLIGDLPFFVSPDSSDVWANPEFFLLDKHRQPRVVAGVPPDCFSQEGQRWGNPIYNWRALRRDGFRWCIQRLRALLAHVDAVRLDHFLAFSEAWHIPADAPSALFGRWVPGPGADFFTALRRHLHALPFIAEDLGHITPQAIALLNRFRIPGNRVLQFAFDGTSDNPHLPQNIVPNSVVYTGTHDNATTRQWYGSLTAKQRRLVWQRLGRSASAGKNAAREMIHQAWHSPAALAIAPLQDLLNLGAAGRMNRPGEPGGNWRWRCTRRMINTPAWPWLQALTKASGRS